MVISFGGATMQPMAMSVSLMNVLEASPGKKRQRVAEAGDMGL